jgi:hypothetical protein
MTVTLGPFRFQFVFPSLLQQLTPINAVYETGTFTNSGSGDVTGPVIPVDINLVPPRASTSGCEAADFAGLDFSGPQRHRAHPARHLHLRRQGTERPSRRRRGGHHLQPGQHARP